jgi:hypothetical protein
VDPGPAPDLAEIRRSEQAETGAWDEVEAAVLARSAGRSRAEMRQMLIAELQSLNRPVPDDRILDLRVEQVTFVPQPLPPDASAFTALKALAGMVRQGRAVHKKLAAIRGEVPPARRAGGAASLPGGGGLLAADGRCHPRAGGRGHPGFLRGWHRRVAGAEPGWG